MRDLISSGKYKNTKQKRAQILLGANESEGAKRLNGEEIKRAYGSSIQTIEQTRQCFVEDGYEIALNGKSGVHIRDNHQSDTYVQLIAYMVEEMYREAIKVALIEDNLSAHKLATLYEIYEHQRARAIIQKDSILKSV